MTKKKPIEARRKPVKLLTGGNPQIAMADGAAPIKAYIAAMPGWKSGVGRRLDELITRVVPGVRKAVKWNSPFYGIDGGGWFMAFHVYTRALKVSFFKGTSLKPAPAGGTSKEMRWIDVHESDLDEAQMTKWIKQAAACPAGERSERAQTHKGNGTGSQGVIFPTVKKLLPEILSEGLFV